MVVQDFCEEWVSVVGRKSLREMREMAPLARGRELMGSEQQSHVRHPCISSFLLGLKTSGQGGSPRNCVQGISSIICKMECGLDGP